MSGVVESLASAFAYDRAAVAAGEGWRLFTGLASHWSLAHAASDGAAIGVLAWAIRRRDGARTLLTLVAIAIVTQAAGVTWLSDATQYRGSSGIAWALGAFALVRAVDGRLQGLAAAALCTVALAAPSLVPSVLPAGVLPDPAMHFAGALAGSAVALAQRCASVSMSSLLRFT